MNPAFVYALLCAVLHLSQVLSSGGSPAFTIDVLLNSTDFETSGHNTVYEFGPENSYTLLFNGECPNDTFSIQQNSVIITGPYEFSTEDLEPKCISTSLGYVNSIQTHNCFVVVESGTQSYGVLIIINVLPNLSSAQIRFQEEFYSVEVTEGVEGAVLLSGGGIQAITVPVSKLLTPAYRVLSGHGSFEVSEHIVKCVKFLQVHTTQALDRESQDYHELTVEAYGLQTSANTTIRVSVLDRNDNGPEFQPPPATSKTLTDSLLQIGEKVAQFQATDSDSGVNGRISYSLTSTSSPFTVDPITGSLFRYSSQSLFETTETIRVSDSGSPQHEILTNFTIFIDNSHQQSPLIHEVGSLVVSEDDMMDRVVSTIHITYSGNLVVSLDSFDCNCFKLSDLIDTPMGEYSVDLLVNSSLDFESFPEGVSITLTASDPDNTELVATQDVTVVISDVNEAPLFPEGEYRVSVLEETPIGSEVFRAEAIDLDSGSNGDLSYTFTSAPQSNPFTLGLSSGIVHTNAELDYETIQSIELVITAEDGGGEMGQTTLKITIIDNNDQRPSFSQSAYTVTIPETVLANESIFHFAASDGDTECNGAVSYTVIFAEPPVFRLDSFSGLLYPLNDDAIDHELFQEAEVIVRATDLGRDSGEFADTTLHVNIIGVNDKRPVMSNIDCPCFMQEATSTTQFCQQLSAHDADSTSLTFSIESGDDQNLFVINPETGVISSSMVITYVEDLVYSLEIIASDGDFDSDPETLNIIIVDKNNVNPFYPGPIELTAPLDAPIGFLVVDLSVQHGDTGYNALTEYEFTSDAVTDVFGLDALSGKLYLKSSVQSETDYSFNVRATDTMNMGSNIVTISVTVIFSGQYNHPPNFEASAAHIDVASMSTVGTGLYTFSAVDDDSGSNGRLTYSLETSSEFFEVNSSGILSLSQSLSNQVGSEFTLTLLVSDGGSPSESDSIQLLITVYASSIILSGQQLQYNPGLGIRHYFTSIPEETSLSLPVLELPEEEGGNAVNYVIIEQAYGAFGIEGNSVVSNSGFQDVFNREANEEVFIRIRAQYGTNFHYLSVTVAIADINNNGPSFSSSTYSTDIYRETPLSGYIFELSASDRDIGSNAVTSYTLEPSSDTFDIVPDTGFVRVIGEITESAYSLTVIASDSESSGLPSSTATLMITVLEITNSDPYVLPNTFPISESAAVGDIVGEITVTDVDSGSHGRNTICLASGNVGGHFNVREDGNIIIHRKLDFETRDSYTLTIMAYDSSPNPASSQSQITVNVEEGNDRPEFTAEKYFATIVEKTPAMTSVLTVAATDVEMDDIEYSILNGTTAFSVDSVTGIVSILLPLNRESVAEHRFTVAATDDRGLASYANVVVSVLDENDNDPSFTSTNFVTLSEDTQLGSQVTQLEADDDDIGRNGSVYYEILSGNEENTFSLDPFTGSLTLRRTLDYESGPQTLQLLLRASDLGVPPRTSETYTVTFSIENANDNSPIFSSSLYYCNIREGTNDFVSPCEVNATDRDELDSISYDIDSGNMGGAFQIHPQTGVISREMTINRETTSLYILKIKATDSGSPLLSSYAVVMVEVSDENDNVPTFDPVVANHVPDSNTRLSHLSFSELLPRNTLLFFAHATDNDSGENGEISYSIVSDESSLFEIDSNSSAVFLTGSFDFETLQSHDLIIRATNPSGTATQHSYTLTVLNENENIYPPKFSPNSAPAVSVSIAAPIGAHLLSVNASDADTGPAGEVRYYITGGSGYGYFTIDQLQGEISVRYPLTGIEASELALEILARDLGNPPLSSAYSLLVFLEPDSGAKPFFTEAQFTAFALETFSSEIFTSVRALVDSQLTSDITYSIESGNEGGKFMMNSSSGAISTTGTLNREAESMYTLYVSASRGSEINTSHAIVAIEVADRNDHTPSFPVSFDVTIFNNHPTGLENSFMRVFAIDEDEGDNSRLEYSLTSDTSGNFAIDSNTGDLYLIQGLPDTGNSLSYEVSVRVTDMATLPLSQSATLTITVTPPADSVNNVAPSFSLSSIGEQISEDNAPGLLVYTAQASDSDNLVYRIINPLPEFAIIPNSGEVYMIRSLDREDESQYTIRIQASDGALTSSIFLLNVVVTDVNDNRPEFTANEFVFTVEEHSDNGVFVGQLTAEDIDSSNAITYSLVDSEHSSSVEIFSLTSGGVLQVAGTIDREVLPTHSLTVAAEDDGTPSLTSYARVKVIVTDINDHAPVFVSPLQNVSISESATVGTPISTVSVFDPDSTGPLSYTLLPGTASFAVNESTGELTVASELDAEEETSYSLTVSVSDGDSTATMTLEVSVVDKLDSLPLLSNPGTVTVPENMPPYSIVTTVADSDNLRAVHYEIISGNEENHFFIESLTGILRTAVRLDRELTQSYTLTVQGAFQQSHESSITLSVVVGDANDNAPTFSHHYLQYTLPEDSPVSTSLLRLDFLDRDAGSNRQIGDFLIPDPRAASVFDVDSSGNLRIIESLDREGKFDEIDFEVYLFDSGSPPLYDLAHVSVTVSDVNDSPPYFLQSSYSFVVSLPALVDTVLFSVEAADLDEESTIRYRISDGNGTDKFGINAITGGISITDNYRLEPHYRLVVSARDEGGEGEAVTVSITTKECGFNNLLFDPRELTMRLPENVTNDTTIFSPTVLTFDVPAYLLYSFSTADSLFAINNSTGRVSLRMPLDREQQSTHHLSVQARDTDDPSRSAQADIEIIVTDINDNAPTFDRDSYELYITSNYSGNIIRLRALDSDEGSNSEVSYFLESGCSGAFEIEENTGQISLTASLDMFIQDSCTLVIRASDKGEPQMSDETTVTMNLVDSNAPLFTENGAYSARVSELAPRGTVVIGVHAEATSSHPDIRYNIDSSQATALPFSIDFTSGNVTVNGIGLDYETNTSYRLRLEAIDLSNSLMGMASLDIEILDENDNRPEFSMALYQSSVTENANSGVSVEEVSARDLDSGTNADITYFIDPNDIATTFFNIDDETGLITTGGAIIDREQNDLFRFSVLAMDAGNPSLTGTTIVQIEVLDVNDNSPTFSEPSYQTTILEEDPAGTSVIFLTATDLDNDEIEYGLVPTPGSLHFEISSSGLVTLTTAASSLSDDQYQLTVSAFDGMFYGYTEIVVDLNNVNNNPPMFNATVYSAYVVENADIGAVVTQVFASDEDRGMSGEVTYSLSSDLFDIDPDTGVITVDSELDREANPNGVTLIVIARDGGGRTGTTEVDIELGDVNDNQPTFTSLLYSFDVSETADVGTTVSTSVVANDPDNGANGTVQYSINTDDPLDQFPFNIDEQSGAIMTILPVDPDVQEEYVFTVSAVDTGTPQMSAVNAASVTVRVIADGAVLPRFENLTYERDILENNQYGVVLFTPQLLMRNVCDLVDFSLLSDGGLFDIDEDSGTITVTTILDREEMAIHSFTIQADCLPLEDSTLISQFAPVTVNVLDVNEEPSFDPSFLRASILENIAIDSILQFEDNVVTVEANDEDSGTNGDISYSIDSDEEVPFTIHPGTGFITVSGDLDRESIDGYRFDVVASDFGNPPLTDNIRIIVSIEDTNDSPPIFDEPLYHGEVAEDAIVGTSIITVTASDADLEEFGVSSYSISGSNLFGIDGSTGEVMVAGSLDRETRSTYTLQITATDGVNEAMTSVTINVTDVNDNPPIFNNTEYEVLTYENSETSITIVQVYATDEDVGENADIRYGILEDQQLIQINSSTGEISFSETPDYELSPQGHFEFRVTATNPNNKDVVALTTLVIDLIDLNDNAPQFSDQNGPFSVLENQSGGVIVVRIIAEDLDSGSNSRVEYTLSQESQDYFTIEPQTGTIRSSVTFDREMNSSYEITVTATDLGDPPLSSNTTILVTIADENDNRPLFSQDSYTVSVFEGAAVGTSIQTIRADDADEGTNAELMYRLTGDNSAHFVLIVHSSDGSFNVQVAQMLNHENIAEYDLSLTAFDGGFPFLQTTVPLAILVLDENDNPPEFDPPFYSVEFPEDLMVGSEIVTVQARDPDSAETTQLTYSIQDPSEHPQFQIGVTDGRILLAEPLDFEDQESHVLIVEADDQVNTPATATVIVTVTNVNDNPPLFTVPTYTASITENEPGKTLFDFTVIDRDIGSDPSIVSFEIESGNSNGIFAIFTIDPTSGVLTVVEFDYEEFGTSQYLLTVTANDNADPPLTGTATVTVTIHDTNDNAPTSEDQVIHVFLYNGQLTLTTLGKLSIRDPDTVNNHQFAVSGDSSVFSIESSGDINVVLRPPPPGSYSFIVNVTDGSLGSAIAHVDITVVNLTDTHLANSFTMRVAVETPKLFIDQHLRPFLTAIEMIVRDKASFASPSASVFNITDNSRRTVDVSVVVQSEDGSPIHPNLVQHLIHINREAFEVAIDAGVVTENVDKCADESACPTGMACTVSLQHSSSSVVIGSAAASLVGIVTGESVTCSNVTLPPSCLVPCQEPSYCALQNGQSVCVNDCSSDPCKNNGKCLEEQMQGYYCTCPSGYNGRNCELTTSHFPEDSYAILPAVSTSTNGTILIEFLAAEGEEGLLYYSSRFDNNQEDFLALEVISGQVSLFISYGGGAKRLQARHNAGHWHTAVVEYTTSVSIVYMSTRSKR